MIPFQDITLADKDTITSFTMKSNRRNCDLSFSNLCSWRFLYNTQFAVVDNFLVFKFWAGEQLAYMMPVGTGDLKAALKELIEDAGKENQPFCMLGVCANMRAELETILPEQFTFMEDLHINNEYEYIMQQQGQASILAIPCERRKYGVGYTNIIEALPYYIPILMTHNPDIHIDLEKECIGYLIEPYDVEAWKEKIIYLKQHPEVIETMSKHAKKLTEGEYNARTTASYIMNDFIRITQ